MVGGNCVLLRGKKSFSQRRKDRRKGRQAALQEKRTVGCDEPPNGRIGPPRPEPQQKARRRSKPEESHFSGLLCGLCADLCVFARNSFEAQTLNGAVEPIKRKRLSFERVVSENEAHAVLKKLATGPKSQFPGKDSGRTQRRALVDTSHATGVVVILTLSLRDRIASRLL